TTRARSTSTTWSSAAMPPTLTRTASTPSRAPAALPGRTPPFRWGSPCSTRPSGSGWRRRWPADRRSGATSRVLQQYAALKVATARAQWGRMVRSGAAIRGHGSQEFPGHAGSWNESGEEHPRAAARRECRHADRPATTGPDRRRALSARRVAGEWRDGQRLARGANSPALSRRHQVPRAILDRGARDARALPAGSTLGGGRAQRARHPGL